MSRDLGLVHTISLCQTSPASIMPDAGLFIFIIMRSRVWSVWFQCLTCGPNLTRPIATKHAS